MRRFRRTDVAGRSRGQIELRQIGHEGVGVQWAAVSVEEGERSRVGQTAVDVAVDADAGAETIDEAGLQAVAEDAGAGGVGLQALDREPGSEAEGGDGGGVQGPWA